MGFSVDRRSSGKFGRQNFTRSFILCNLVEATGESFWDKGLILDCRWHMTLSSPIHIIPWSFDMIRGKGYSQKSWVGLCGPLPQTFTLFMSKICDIPYPIYDQNTLKSVPYS